MTQLPLALLGQTGRPLKHGLYDPAQEKDSCGVGFVAHIKGIASHQNVLDGAAMLVAMEHRGACGCEENTGDGAGMLTALPHKFLRKVAKAEWAVDLPQPGQYAAGLVFLPHDEAGRAACKAQLEALIKKHGQKLLGWRQVPVAMDKADIGPTARAAAPVIEQLFVVAEPSLSQMQFEQKLYLIRKQASNTIRTDKNLVERQSFYICSLSTRTIIYKGMLTSGQLLPFFPDLADPDYETHLAMVHSRFSTNTFPSWDRAQPLRYLSHNGEINTVRGNANWIQARQGAANSQVFGDELQQLFPVVEPDCSDSGTFDNVLEFLMMNGRTMQEAVMMMVPEAWQKHQNMPAGKRALYEFMSTMMEPWDGPASITFTDGDAIGAILDRNGLRPSRYYLTHDDRVIMASEVGVLPIDPANIKKKGRLKPGFMFLVDFREGRLIPDGELKAGLAAARPYAKWLEENMITLDELKPKNEPHGFYPDTLIARMKAFGYTVESMNFMLLPMIRQARDPIGSMGNDAALACLSDQPRMIYDYFKQLFAQVTNPAIDAIREEVVMSLESFIGPEKNLLTVSAKHAERLKVPHPILTNEELASIEHMTRRGWRTRVIDITFDRTAGAAGLDRCLSRICQEAEQAVDEGKTIAILSDRSVCADRVAASSLLACGAVHQHLVRQAKRTRIGIVLESGEAREVHHHCLLVGYGADAINPYLAFEALWQARRDGQLAGVEFDTDDKIVHAYRKAVAKGMLKVMAKMGISTLQSYKGAQIFEALGLHDDVMGLCFSGTASRIQGVSFGGLAKEIFRRHRLGFPREVSASENVTALKNSGEFHWRADGERHGWDPQAIADIQVAARRGDAEAYQRFADHVNRDSKAKYALRGLLSFKPGAGGATVPLAEVEPATEIVKRFCTGAMSFGSISPEAHETLAIAMNRLGGKSNTGEGGEDPARFTPLANGDSKRSAIKQVASGRFGVTIDYLTNADELQIKVSQGAKPGEGGELPGNKVDETIARLRYSTPGVGLISPPPHHDIYSIEDLAQLIYDLKNANREARISVKLVSEVGVGVVAAGVSKAHAEHIVIAGDVGGTGASALTSIKHAGLPWELGLAEAHQTLVLNGLRRRVVLQTDGGLKTGRDVVVATLLGAEEFGFATAPLITLGCIMMRKCHLNTCPVGIATQDVDLRKKFAGAPEHLVNYLFMVAEEARNIMAMLGFRTINEMVGRVDALEAKRAIDHWKADGLDLSDILSPAQKITTTEGVIQSEAQEHGLERSLDLTMILPQAKKAIEEKIPVRIELPVLNTHRTIGTILSHEITKRHGPAGLPNNTVHLCLSGSVGQSLGAFLTRGVTIELEGDANDYVGKGLSGGRVIIYPPKAAGFVAEENIIVGNVCLYGATGGEVFFRGCAAERFAVRNSGANAVVEGVGDHGCEYMTGGRVIILGETGRNFAAGMSGGIAYVWDRQGDFPFQCNTEMVCLEEISDKIEEEAVRELITRHCTLTGSARAAEALADWPSFLSHCIKVMPVDYKNILRAQATATQKSTGRHG